MTRTSRISWIIAASVAALVTGTMFGQPTESGDPAPLAGPSVTTDERRYIYSNFHGEVERPGARPEELALSSLDLDAADRSRVSAILRRREQTLDRIVAENLDLLTMLGTASETGDRLDQFILGVRLLEKFRPLARDGALRQEIAAALPTAQAKRFEAALNEYWRQVGEHGKDKPDDRGRPQGRLGAVLAEMFQILGEEIERSFQRQVQSGQLVVTFLLADLDLSPEQEARLAELTADFAQRTMAKPTEQQQLIFGLSLAAHLTEAQRRIVLERIKNLTGGRD